MLIGLTGYAGTGKDTIAEVLETHHNFVQLSFAAPLKSMFCEQNNMSLMELEARKRSELWIREGLQELGMSKRAIDPDYWVNLLLSDLEFLSELRMENFVISDVRYDNEVRFVHSQQGRVWRVERPGHGPVNAHISEQPVQGVDLVINNHRSVRYLHMLTNRYLEAEVLNTVGRHLDISI